MSDRSAIEWTDATWSPVTGCTKVRLHPERLDDPLRWRKPRRVFVCSLADLFDEVPTDFIAAVWSVMAGAGNHVFQVLTKRPGRMRSLLASEEFREAVAQACVERWGPLFAGLNRKQPWPLPNVWIGTSVENQRWADVRIPKLLATHAAVRFLSCEPLIGPVDLRPFLGSHASPLDHKGLGWVIVGGESGPGARPMHPDWARSLRDQCAAAGVPFFFKQWGEWTPAGYHEATHLLHIRGGEGTLVPREGATRRVPVGFAGSREEDLVDRGHQGWVRVARVGKKRAGRVLDGRTWDEMPERAG